MIEPILSTYTITPSTPPAYHFVYARHITRKQLMYFQVFTFKRILLKQALGPYLKVDKVRMNLSNAKNALLKMSTEFTKKEARLNYIVDITNLTG